MDVKFNHEWKYWYLTCLGLAVSISVQCSPTTLPLQWCTKQLQEALIVSFTIFQTFSYPDCSGCVHNNIQYKKSHFFSSASYKVCTLLTHFHFQHHSKNNYMLHFHISLFKVIVEHPLLNFGGRPGIQPFIIKTNLIKYGLLLFFFFLIHLNQFTSCITLLVESAWFILYIIHLCFLIFQINMGLSMTKILNWFWKMSTSMILPPIKPPDHHAFPNY